MTRVSIKNYKQWKDLLIFKRYNGHHVWNLPKFNPNEFGYRRIARKPPFFKFRRYTFPKIIKCYNYGKDVLFNRDLYIKYNWGKYSQEFHQLNEFINDNMKGINVIGIPTEDTTHLLQIFNHNGKNIFNTSDKQINNMFDIISKHIIDD